MEENNYLGKVEQYTKLEQKYYTLTAENKELKDKINVYQNELARNINNVSKEIIESQEKKIAELQKLAEQVLKAKMPEKDEHSNQCVYVLEKSYFGNPSKEKFCTCGAYEYNQAIDDCTLILARDYISKDKLLSVEEIEGIILVDDDLAREIFTAQQEKMKGVKP